MHGKLNITNFLKSIMRIDKDRELNKEILFVST